MFDPIIREAASRFGLGEKAGPLVQMLLAYLTNKGGGVSPEMALRLSKALGRSVESWLTMQDNYDLWQAKQTLDLANVSKIEFKYA